MSRVMVSRKREIGQFHVVVALRGKKSTKKCDAPAKLLLCLSKCTLFCHSCCCPHSHCFTQNNIPQNSGSEQLGIKQQFSFRRWQC